MTVTRQPGLFLAGCGVCASTLKATRAGRKATVAAMRFSQLAAF